MLTNGAPASTRTILGWLMMACLLPGMIGAAAVLYLSYRSERAQLERGTIQTARALMQAVDGELVKAQAVALTLASSSHLGARNLAAFHAYAKGILQQTEIGNNVVLTDSGGQQLVNTILPFAGPLPRHGNPAQARRVFETGMPLVSDIYIGGVLRRPVMSIDVPVFLDGKIAYDLSIGLFPERLEKIVRTQQLPPEWVVSIFDSQGVIAARSHSSDKFVGQKGSPVLLQRMTEVGEGSVDAPTLEGIPVSAAFSRSPTSKWAVAIGIPTEALTADLRQRFQMLLVSMAILLAIAVALATLLADRIGRSIRALTGPALALGSGAPVVVPPVHLREAEEVGTAIVAASKLLTQADADRRSSEARLNAHLGNSPLAIVEFDRDFRVTRWSKEAERLFGWSSAEILGRAITEMRWVHEDDMEAVRRVSGEMLSGARPRNMCSNRNYRKDGSVIHCEWYNSALHDDDGNLISILSQVLDVTERDLALAAMSAAKDEAEHANRAKSVFLATMSHEIRTPLHIILGLGHLLQRNLSDPIQLKRVDQLCANSDHLLALVNDILDLSKIEADRLVLDVQGFRLGAVVDRVLGIVVGLARDKGLTVSADVAAPVRDLELRGDPLRLSQILVNLGSNAVKFTDEGAIRLDIACLTENATSATLRFSVEDTGMGIAVADQDRLFRAFSQLDGSSTRAHGGTGLGLAISQRLAAMMGGNIEVRSQPGAGSCFSFELTFPRAVRPHASAKSAATDLCGVRVLCVEDHPLSQEILLEMLEDLGCLVDVASDGAEAVACAQARGYDLILMDMQMPTMDGLQATHAIRLLPAHRDTPIIALTANAFAEDRQRCLDAGMNGHLGKPVTPATLAATLGQWASGVSASGEDAPLFENELTRALADIPGLDIPQAMRKTAEQLTAYCGLLHRFVDAHREDMAKLRESLSAGDLAAAQTVAHNLKGIAGMMGVRGIATLADKMVQELRAKADAIAIGALSSECEVELAALDEAIHREPLLAAAPSNA